MTLLAAVWLMAIPSCSRCVVQGPFCNRNMVNQSMIDLDINNNPRYLTDSQRRAACVTLASNYQPWILNMVVTNITYTNATFVTNIVTNTVTNNVQMPPNTSAATNVNTSQNMSWIDMPVSQDLYGQNCLLTWQ